MGLFRISRFKSGCSSVSALAHGLRVWFPSNTLCLQPFQSFQKCTFARSLETLIHVEVRHL